MWAGASYTCGPPWAPTLESGWHVLASSIFAQLAMTGYTVVRPEA